MTPVEVAEWIMRVAGVLVAVGAIWRYCVLPPIRFAKRVESAITATESQLKPNNGTSLRDVANRTEASIAKIEDHIAGHAMRLDLLERVADRQAEIEHIVTHNKEST